MHLCTNLELCAKVLSNESGIEVGATSAPSPGVHSRCYATKHTTTPPKRSKYILAYRCVLGTQAASHNSFLLELNNTATRNVRPAENSHHISGACANLIMDLSAPRRCHKWLMGILIIDGCLPLLDFLSKFDSWSQVRHLAKHASIVKNMTFEGSNL